MVSHEVKATGSSFVIPDTEQSTPAPSINKPVKLQVKISPPNVSVPSNTSGDLRNLSQTGKNNYLDTTRYSRRERQNQSNSPSVVVSDRLTGCQTVVNGGGMNKGNCGSQRVISPKITASVTNTRRITQRRINQNLTASKFERKYNTVARNSSYTSNKGANYEYKNPNISYNNSNNGNNFNNYQNPNSEFERSVPPEYSHAARLNNVETNGNTALLFPLSIPSRISSTFGWRIHPITGNRSIHHGTDISAPMGTPVLAAYPGEVAIAENVGGYGLTVILRHENGSQESRYAHLSEIFVNAGDWIEQGSVIGLVGSTGFSTGPHLHFEWRHLTQSGWVAVDAGLHLQYALDNLIQSMEMAQNRE
jgi:murein DD-endopeptidase MepM/ murein hydrolase activator NlpD